MLDTKVKLLNKIKGPEIRTGFLESGSTIEIEKDQILEISTLIYFKF